MIQALSEDGVRPCTGPSAVTVLSFVQFDICILDTHVCKQHHEANDSNEVLGFRKRLVGVTIDIQIHSKTSHIYVNLCPYDCEAHDLPQPEVPGDRLHHAQ